MSAPLTRLAPGPDEAAAVALGIADFLVRTEMERLRLFRRHLHATVRRVSPLLIELALMEGVSLSDAVDLIHPPQDWPWRPLSDFSPSLVRRSQQRKAWLGSAGPRDVARFRRAFANPGVVVREADHPRGRFGVHPCEGVLGFTAAIGPCLLSAFGATAMLKLHQPLPETLMAAMPGRRLGQLIDHPLIAAGDHTVLRVQPDLGDGLPVISFRAPLVRFEMPFGGVDGVRWP